MEEAITADIKAGEMNLHMICQYGPGRTPEESFCET